MSEMGQLGHLALSARCPVCPKTGHDLQPVDGRAERERHRRRAKMGITTPMSGASHAGLSCHARCRCCRKCRWSGPAPSSAHRGQADFRAGHGDQFGRRGSRPKQAERDQGGEADQSYATHFQSLILASWDLYVFRRPNIGVSSHFDRLRPAGVAAAVTARALFWAELPSVLERSDYLPGLDPRSIGSALDISSSHLSTRLQLATTMSRVCQHHSGRPGGLSEP